MNLFSFAASLGGTRVKPYPRPIARMIKTLVIIIISQNSDIGRRR
jgi:hypothetical protein